MTKDIRQARAEADAARAKLRDTVAALRYRTTPKVIARDVADGTLERVRHAMASGDSAMRARPWSPWAIGAVLGSVTALRFVRRRRPRNETSAIDES